MTATLLTADEAVLLNRLNAAPAGIDTLLRGTLTIQRAQCALVTLELRGLARREPGNRFRLLPEGATMNLSLTPAAAATIAPVAETPPTRRKPAQVSADVDELAVLRAELVRAKAELAATRPATPEPQYAGELSRYEHDGTVYVIKRSLETPKGADAPLDLIGVYPVGPDRLLKRPVERLTATRLGRPEVQRAYRALSEVTL